MVDARNLSAYATRNANPMIRLCRPVLAAILVALATPSLAGSSGPTPVENQMEQQSSFIDLLALMSGQCKTLRIAGREFACKAVAYAHGDKGRVNFAVAVDDPADDSHVVLGRERQARRRQFL